MRRVLWQLAGFGAGRPVAGALQASAVRVAGMRRASNGGRGCCAVAACCVAAPPPPAESQQRAPKPATRSRRVPALRRAPTRAPAAPRRRLQTRRRPHAHRPPHGVHRHHSGPLRGGAAAEAAVFRVQHQGARGRPAPDARARRRAARGARGGARRAAAGARGVGRGFWEAGLRGPRGRSCWGMLGVRRCRSVCCRGCQRRRHLLPASSRPPNPCLLCPRAPQVILSSKIAPRALSGVNSPDPLCARHALALAALVARDAPALFIDHVAHLIQGNLDIFEATGATELRRISASPAFGSLL